MKSKNESNRNQSIKIPITGKINRFVNNVKKETNSTVFQKVINGMEEFESTTNKAKKAKWMQKAIQRLENTVGREKSRNIMENCGRECFDQHNIARDIKTKSLTVDEIIERLNKGSISLRREDEKTIIGEYSRCYCHIVKETEKPFPNDTYCQCSVGWWKQLFESALKKPIDVELVHSIISGAKTCKFLIHI